MAVLHRAGRGTGAGGLGDRPALGVVGVEQGHTRPAVQHGGQLPGQVVGVLDAGVGAERPGGRHLVRRVTGQEHPALGVPLGDPLGGVPGRPPGDRHIEIGDADGPPDVGGAPLVGELLERLAVFGVPGRVEDPVLTVVHREQRAVGVRAGEVADDELPVVDDPGEVPGGEGDADVVEQVAGSVLPDAEPLAHGAAGAVRGDQVVRPYGGVLARLAALEVRRHPVGILVEGHHLGAEAQVAAEFPGARQQHGLEVVLAAQTPAGRAEAGEPAAGVDLTEQPLAGVARQARRLQDAVVVRQHRRRLRDAPLHPGGPEQLHRADVVAPAARVDRRARVTFDECVRHPEPPQEQGHGQPHQGAADDEDGRAVNRLAGRVGSVHGKRLQRRPGRAAERDAHSMPGTGPFASRRHPDGAGFTRVPRVARAPLGSRQPSTHGDPGPSDTAVVP